MKKTIRHILISIILLISIIFYFSLPKTLFEDPLSDILYSSEGELLEARIASDGQWRFPVSDSIPYKFSESIKYFEDKRFEYHPGFDPLAIGRALIINLKSNKIKSGGSTITMQLIRLSRKNKQRTYFEKVIELILACRAELRYSKKEIMLLYSSFAPFGGNVVGLEAASWRYFGRPSDLLSWAESATLAVLPNSPAIIHPGRNREVIKVKRDKLLKKLLDNNIINQTIYDLSLEEPIPEQPKKLPSHAYHLMSQSVKEGRRGKINTTIDYNLQKQANNIVKNYIRQYEYNYVNNLAVIVAEVKSGNIIAYVGNGMPDGNSLLGRSVNMVEAERSTGSVLKPLLYAAMLDEGIILPKTLQADYPLFIQGFAPQNYNKTFQGAVPADEAISRSLNVPLVRMVIDYDYGKFYEKLKTLGMKTLHFGPEHYGASIILGGAEGTLRNMTSIYASLARTLDCNDYHKSDYRELNYIPQEINIERDATPPLTRPAIWYAFKAMTNLNRHEEESEWINFSSMKKIAWKTGTSYGGRDAWAVGLTKEYIVGVWAGNSSGEGRSGVTGVGYAAPVLFDIFSLLPSSTWFDEPLEEMRDAVVCHISGYRAGEYCDEKDTIQVPKSGLKSDICPYHKQILLDPSRQYRAGTECFPASSLVPENRFVLPPAMEWYYKECRTGYRSLPPFYPGCESEGDKFEIIYPKHGTKIYLPIGFFERKEKVVLRAAHSRNSAVIYWYIDQNFIGETSLNHEIAVSPDPGIHTLTLTDETGETKKILIEVFTK